MSMKRPGEENHEVLQGEGEQKASEKDSDIEEHTTSVLVPSSMARSP